MSFRVAMFAAIASIAMAGSSSAKIVSGVVTGGDSGGVFLNLTPVPPLGNPFGTPNEVGQDTFDSPNLYGFDEAQNHVLAADLAVDIGMNPIPAGKTISSHYIFFDPGPTSTIVGSVKFDGMVIGIITSLGNLMASDFLGVAGITYLSPPLRGLEMIDVVTITAPDTIKVDYRADTPGDYIRVITMTAAIPEPSTIVLAGFGVVALAFAGRRKVARSAT